MTMYDEKGNEIKIDKKTDKARKAAFDQISKKAILVNMTRKQISNLPFDVNISSDIAKKMNVADPSMVQVRKLLINPQHLSKIRSLINDAMLMVWNHTRPWDNIGYRLLPMEYYDDFNESFSKIKDEFEEAVKEFIDNYDTYVAESKKNLGKFFDKNDYPDKAQLTNMFALDIHTTQFPDIDDIRLNMSGPELVEMKEEVVGQYKDIHVAICNKLLDFAESDSEHKDEFIKAAKKLNELDPSSTIEMRIAEVLDGAELKDDVEDDDEESMMVMDDLDDLKDLDDLGINDDLL